MICIYKSQTALVVIAVVAIGVAADQIFKCEELSYLHQVQAHPGYTPVGHWHETWCVQGLLGAAGKAMQLQLL